jgi:8-oxo-dGTP pyrophosphatase MutT (NUDIX family)/GNAT superfamily N-acetyltransferase
MGAPDFVLALRAAVGHDLLWMPGVSAVVLNDRGEVLLGLRADNGTWSLVSGILEPGEQPAEGLVREVEEETGVVVRVEALTGVWTMPELAYPNGDRAQYLDLCFLCRHVSGEARVNDDESLEVRWFPPDALPPMPERSRARLERALAHAGPAWFEGLPPAEALPRPDAPRPAHPDVLTRLGAGGEVTVRRARGVDVPAIVALLADDPLGAAREDSGDLAAYQRAFAAIDADPAHLLVVAEHGGAVVGTLQLTFIPGLSRGGSLRAQVEAVRVARAHRGEGLGRSLLDWAIEESRRRGCSLVQLTTDRQRTEAQQFYERLGFTPSHAGMKLAL